MSDDDRRLLDASSPASPLLRDLLASASADDPSAQQLDRVAQGLIAQGVGVPLIASKTATTLASLKTKALLGVLVFGVAGAGGYSLTRANTRAPVASNIPAAVSVSAPVPTASPNAAAQPEQSLIAPSAEPSAQRVTPPAAVPRRVQTRPTAEVPSESELLNQALTALSAHEGQRALSIVAQHRAAYPHGGYQEEFQRVRIEALVLSGRNAEARAAADRFLVEHPRSAYRVRIRNLVGAP